jgi:hypothetical protein
MTPDLPTRRETHHMRTAHRARPHLLFHLRTSQNPLLAFVNRAISAYPGVLRSQLVYISQIYRIEVAPYRSERAGNLAGAGRLGSGTVDRGRVCGGRRGGKDTRGRWAGDGRCLECTRDDGCGSGWTGD